MYDTVEREAASRPSLGDIRNSVLIAPLGSPLPAELEAIATPATGSLYARLSPLAQQTAESAAVALLSGVELLNLERVWSSLVLAKRVFVVNDLPGARYDVTFTQARRVLGLASVDWSHISESLAEAVRTNQQLSDTKPWVTPEVTTLGAPKEDEPEKGFKRGFKRDELPIPEASDENP